ncbi:uncharacterized protein BEWA_042740 [Theileria equi strain WA]|uniref:Membrane protein, putative n=1 Tax=Theileria equi strain WA TaxID=1537102 RepID=L1LFV7_THEEQ|nr:uncharacterized protein BEWA_042740 [Theileria equi strain WA]EKX74236.1 membrane protein, putative [Theileria equi strain WA]|eukprot:XP_004833688.1 uncharacterized protein BEWA_042740 [Theileria equi strain WA]
MEDDDSSRRLFFITHTVCAIFALTAGITLGIYFVKPSIDVKYENNDENINTWNIQLDGDGKVVTGGQFSAKLGFYNNSIFPIRFQPSEVSLHYFPIGTNPSCLFLHSADSHFTQTSGSANISQVLQSINQETKDGFLSLDNFEVTIKSSKWNYTNPTYFDLKWNIGLQVPDDKLGMIYQIYMDCKHFQKVIFSIHLKKNISKYWILKKDLPNSFEIMLPMECVIDDRIYDVFRDVTVVKEDVILKSLSHNPDLFSNSQVYVM